MNHKTQHVSTLIILAFCLCSALALRTQEPVEATASDMKLYSQYLLELSEMKAQEETITKVKQTPDEDENSAFYRTISGLTSSFAFTGLAELGDKTFLMVVIFTGKMNNVLLFWVVSAGLLVMHTLGSLCGGIFQLFLPQYVLNVISVVVFAIFGIALIYIGFTEEEDDAETKIKEVEEELNETMSQVSVEDDEGKGDKGMRCLYSCLTSPGTKLFFITLISEMGDRSQITAVALAATYRVELVIIGGIVGHMLAMLLAIVAGRIISKSIKETTVTIIGGVLFLLFSAYELVFEVLMAN